MSYKHNMLANINSSYASYVREAEWFGNTTNMTAEQIFRIITFNSSEIIDSVKVFTEESVRTFKLDGFRYFERSSS